jgi:predicted RNA-binding Zn ribbon-like protein
MAAYPGPVREEPLSIELHNTLYAVRGVEVDGLADERGVAAWLEAVNDRLPEPAGNIDRERLVALRGVVRDVLGAAAAGRRPSADAIAALNAASAADPRSLEAVWRGGRLHAEPKHRGPAELAVLGAIATDAIALVGGPQAADLHACGAPGCILMFLRDHPRREWCSARCGNRARQARHYARVRAS